MKFKKATFFKVLSSVLFFVILFNGGVASAARTEVSIDPADITATYKDNHKKLELKKANGQTVVLEYSNSNTDNNCSIELETSGGRCEGNYNVNEDTRDVDIKALCEVILNLDNDTCKSYRSVLALGFHISGGKSIDDVTDEIMNDGAASDTKDGVTVAKGGSKLMIAFGSMEPAGYRVRYALFDTKNAINPSGGGGGTAHNGEDWTDVDGNILTRDDFKTDRFRVISPFEIVDTEAFYAGGKNVVYRLGDNENIGGDGQERLMDGGMQYYWPVNENATTKDGLTELDFRNKSQSGICNGGFMIRTGPDEEHKDSNGVSVKEYGAIYAIPAYTFSGSCFVTTDGGKDTVDVNSLRRSFGDEDHPGKDEARWLVRAEFEADTTTKTVMKDKSRLALFFANFWWQNPDTIRAYKGSKPDEGPTLIRWGGPKDPTHNAKFVLDKIGKTTGEIFTAQECVKDGEGGSDYLEAFLYINRDTTNKDISDTDTDSENAKAIVYTKDSGSWEQKWVHDEIDCMTGQKITDNAVTFLFPSDPKGGSIAQQYISYPSRSVPDVNDSPGNVGNADAGYIGDPIDEGEDNAGLNCSWSWSNPLTWIMCPIIEGASKTVGLLDQKIKDNMTVDLGPAGPYDETQETGGAVFQSWSSIRSIALAALVLIALIMIFSQAVSVGPFDAYTIKKVLPRIVISVIFISFSWQLCKLAIMLSNIAGQGVGLIITTPFKELGNANISSLGGSAGLIGIGSALLIGVDPFVILSLALTAFGAVFVAFLTITFRNILIMALMITAPIAIILWILPGTQKAWNFWKTSFLGALLAFPIIVAFITAGRVFAVIASQAPGDGIFKDIIVFLAYFGPYFAIPAAFRIAGGAVAQVGGVFNDRSRGFFDMNKKYRGGKMAKNREKLMDGERGPALVKTASRGFGAFVQSDRKRSFLTQDGRNAAMAQHMKMLEMKYGKKDRTQGTKDDDRMNQALTYESEAQARARLAIDFNLNPQEVDRAIASAIASGGFSAVRQNFAVRALVHSGTGYDNLEQLHRTVARVAGDNRAMASDILGEANAVTKNVGRHDLAPGYAAQMDLYDSLQSRGGYDHVATGGLVARALTVDEEMDAYTQAAKDVDAVTLMRDKRAGVNNMSSGLAHAYARAEATGDSEELGRLSGFISKIEQTGTYASTNNIDAAGDTVVDPTSGVGQVNTVMGPNGNPILVPAGGRQQVVASASPTVVQVNPVTSNLETVYAANPAGGGGGGGTGPFLVDPDTGKPVPAANVAQDADADAMLRRHGQQRPPDPRDPTY